MAQVVVAMVMFSWVLVVLVLMLLLKSVSFWQGGCFEAMRVRNSSVLV